MIQLTEEQRLALQNSSEPIRVTDPKSNREYVLLQAKVYERLKRILAAEEIDPSLYEFEELDRAMSR